MILLPMQAVAEKRFALVIGNSDYNVAGKLPNASNDAKLIAQSFQAVGFETEILTDLSEDGMGEALDRLAQRASSLDVAAIYYAGHAIQKEGQNYLIPVDANIKTETAIERETIALQSFMKALEQVPISLLFLDACRNNPFTEQIARSLSASARSIVVKEGLAVVRPVGDMLITFATLPNTVAFDGKGENSPFARALARQITTPNVEISVQMKRVTRDVVKETNGNQRPQQLSQMQTEFYFSRNAEEEVTRDVIKSVLAVYPGKVKTGEEIALVADVPDSCLPAFFDMASNGKVTPIPRKYFKQITLSNGQARYEISPGSRYGLVIEESDPRGAHILGYFCEPDDLDRDTKVALLKNLKSNFNKGIFEGLLVAGTRLKAQFHFQRYDIQ